MMLSNVIVDAPIPRRSFVFGQSQHLILYTAPCLSYGLSLSLTLVSRRRKVVLCATRIFLTRSSKINYERTTRELTIRLTIDDCLTVTIDG